MKKTVPFLLTGFFCISGHCFFAQNVGINTDGSAPVSLLHISSRTSGDAEVIIEADTDNNNESDNPFITFKQDGNLVNAFIGLEGNAGTRSIGTLVNAFVIGSENGNPPLQFVTNDNVRMTISTVGNVGIGTVAPTSQLQINQDDAATALYVTGGNVGSLL
ncbi:MAG: hypothetical protein COA57_16015, partial [Flavobacteriales bacterium]